MTAKEMIKELERMPGWYEVGIRVSKNTILPVELVKEHNMEHTAILDSKHISDFGKSACSCAEDCMHFEKR